MIGKTPALVIKVLLVAGVVVGGILGGAACTKEVEKEVVVPQEVVKVVEVEKEVVVPQEVVKVVEVEKQVVVPQEVVKVVEVEKEVVVPQEVIVEKVIEKEVPMTLVAVAQKIQSGEIDVGTEDGLGLNQRYHRIHAIVLGLNCTTCHILETATQQQAVFSAQDVSPQAPGPVEKSACLGCHRAGPGHDLYGSGGP